MLVAVATLGFGFLVKAQDKKMKAGLKVGLNMANQSGKDIRGEDIKGTSMRMELNIGATFEYKVMPMLGIEPGGFYSQQGHTIDEDKKANTPASSDNFDYLNIPIAIKYYPIEYVSIGLVPTVGFNINSEIVSEKLGNTEARTSDYNKNKGNDDKEYDISSMLDFALGFDISGHYKGFELGFRYNLGLLNVYDTSVEPVFGKDPKIDTKNNFMTISLGYNLDL